MYNLLPEKERGKALGEYRLRRVLVALSLSAWLLALSIGALAPSLILAEGKMTAAILSESASEGAVDHTLSAWAQEERRLIQALAPAERASAYSSMRQALKDKPIGIKLSGLSWQASPLSLKADGVAKDRQALLDFQNKLGSSGEWGRVDLPVGNLAKDANIDFEITLTPK